MQNTVAACCLLPAVFIVSCTLQPPSTQQVPETETGSQPAIERTEQIFHDSQAPIPVETGSILPTERFLSSGVIEIGDRNAPLTLLVYTEHHCRYCREFHIDHLTRLLSDFVDEGDLKMHFITFPLQKYQDSNLAAQATLCSAWQGKGMQMHDHLFHSSQTNRESILRFAKEEDLNMNSFTQCLEEEHALPMIKQQQDWARTLSVNYVPTFFLDGEKFEGLPYYPDLKERIERAHSPQD